MKILIAFLLFLLYSKSVIDRGFSRRYKLSSLEALRVADFFQFQ